MPPNFRSSSDLVDVTRGSAELGSNAQSEDRHEEGAWDYSVVARVLLAEPLQGGVLKLVGGSLGSIKDGVRRGPFLLLGPVFVAIPGPVVVVLMNGRPRRPERRIACSCMRGVVLIGERVPP
jgi:hypothetical protein